MESSQWENWNHFFCCKVSFLTYPRGRFRGVGPGMKQTLSILLRYTVSDCPFDIFKLFLFKSKAFLWKVGSSFLTNLVIFNGFIHVSCVQSVKYFVCFTPQSFECSVFCRVNTLKPFVDRQSQEPFKNKFLELLFWPRVSIKMFFLRST
jgi:hypothetical protein